MTWTDELFNLLDEIEKKLPKKWPDELPLDTTTPSFWEAATKLEFEHRATLTEKIRIALTGNLQSCSNWSPIEAWLYQRRMEWVTQVVLEGCKQGLGSPGNVRAFLLKIFCDDWSEQGAIAFFDHAMMRDGKPHPDADEDVLRIMS